MGNSQDIEIPEKFSTSLDETILHSLEFWRERIMYILTSSRRFSKPLSNRISAIVDNISMAYYQRERDEFLDLDKYNDSYWKYWVFENSVKLHKPNSKFGDVKEEVEKLARIIAHMMRKKYGIIEGERILSQISHTVGGIVASVNEFSDNQSNVNLSCTISNDNTILKSVKIEGGYGLKNFFEKDYILFYTDGVSLSRVVNDPEQMRRRVKGAVLADFRVIYYSKTHSINQKGPFNFNQDLIDQNFNPAIREYIGRPETSRYFREWEIHYLSEHDAAFKYWEDWPQNELENKLLYIIRDLDVNWELERKWQNEVIYVVKVQVKWVDWHWFIPRDHRNVFYLYKDTHGKDLKLHDDDSSPPNYQDVQNKYDNEPDFIGGLRYCGDVSPSQNLNVELKYQDTGKERASELGKLTYTLLLKNSSGDTIKQESGEGSFVGNFLTTDNEKYEGWASLVINKSFWTNVYDDLDRIIIIHEAKDADEETYTVDLPITPAYPYGSWSYYSHTRDDTLTSQQYTTLLQKKIQGIGIKPFIDLEFKDNVKVGSLPYPEEKIGLYCEFFNPQSVDATVTSVAFAIVKKRSPKPSQWQSFQTFQPIILTPDNGKGGIFTLILEDPSFSQSEIGKYDVWVQCNYSQFGSNLTIEEKGLTYQIIAPEKPTVEYSSTINSETTSHIGEGNYRTSFPFRTDINSVQGNYKPYRQLLKVKIINNSRVLLKFDQNDRKPKFIESVPHDDPKEGISIFLKGDDKNLIEEEASFNYIPAQILPGSNYIINYYMNVNDSILVKLGTDHEFVRDSFLTFDFSFLFYDLGDFIIKLCGNNLSKVKPSYLGIALDTINFFYLYSVYEDTIRNKLRLLEESKIRLEKVSFTNIGSGGEWNYNTGDYIFNNTQIHVLAVPSLGQLNSFGEYLNLLQTREALSLASAATGVIGFALPGWGTLIAWAIGAGLYIGAICATIACEEALIQCNYIDPPELSYKEEVEISPPKEIPIPDLITPHKEVHIPVHKLRSKTEKSSHDISGLKAMLERKTQAENLGEYNYAAMHLKSMYPHFENLKGLKTDIKTHLMEVMSLGTKFFAENEVDDTKFLEIQKSLRENDLPQELIDILQKGKEKDRNPGDDGYLSDDELEKMRFYIGLGHEFKLSDIKNSVKKIDRIKESEKLLNAKNTQTIKDEYIDVMTKLHETDETIEIAKEPSDIQLKELEKLKADIDNASSLGLQSEIKNLCVDLKNKANDLMFELVNNDNKDLNEYVDFANEIYFATYEKEFIRITEISIPPDRIEVDEKTTIKLYLTEENDYKFPLNFEFELNYQHFSDTRIILNGNIITEKTIDIEPKSINELTIEFFLNETSFPIGPHELFLKFWSPDKKYRGIKLNRVYNFELVDEDDKLNSLITIDYQGDYTDNDPGKWEVQVEDPPGAKSDIKVFVDDELSGTTAGLYDVPTEFGEHRIWVETKIQDLEKDKLDIDTGLKTDTVKIYDDDSQIPIIELTYTGDGTDGNPGAFQWKIIEESGIGELEIKVEYKKSHDSAPTEYTPPPTSEGQWELVDLGIYSIYIFARDNDRDRTILIDSLSAEVKTSEQVIDDDIFSPIISNLLISEVLGEISIKFDAFDKKMGDDRGLGMINIFIDGELIHSLISIPDDQTHFDFKFENKWILKQGDHSVLIEVWDSDDDRDFDSLKSQARGSFYIDINLLKNHIISDIDTLFDQISGSPEESWINNQKEIIIHKIDLTRNLILNDQFNKAYNYVLRVLKPQLTGILQDELGGTLGLFISTGVLVADENLKDEYLNTIDQILTKLRTIHQEYGLITTIHWPSHNEISLLAYYNYIDREQYSKPMMINGEEMDFMKIHYSLAKITLILQIRFFNYLTKLNKPIFTVDKMIWRLLEPGDDLKVLMIKERGNKSRLDRLISYFKHFDIPNFGPWYDLDDIDLIRNQIILNARKIRDFNLQFEQLDWFLSENTLLIDKLSQPYRYNVHTQELILVSMLDENSAQKLLINGIDSLALLNELDEGTIWNIPDLDIGKLKDELSKIIWL